MIYRKDIDLFADDNYGHWWIEIDGKESYGRWLPKGVGLKETIFGVPRDLNGQTRFGGSPTLDPLHGDRGKGVNVFQVYSKDGRTKDEITDQIRDYAKKYRGDWRWPVGQNCHYFQEKMLKDLKLEIRKCK